MGQGEKGTREDGGQRDKGRRGEGDTVGVMLLTWIGRPRERLGDFIYIILLNSTKYKFLFFITITISNILFYF